MQNISELLIAADLQIYSNSDTHIYLNLDTSNIITYFKKTYIIPEIFIKDEIVLKDLGMKWNETSFVKIPKDIHLLGKTWIKVTIPYFQMIEKLTSTTTTITKDFSPVISANFRTAACKSLSVISTGIGLLVQTRHEAGFPPARE